MPRPRLTPQRRRSRDERAGSSQAIAQALTEGKAGFSSLIHAQYGSYVGRPLPPKVLPEVRSVGHCRAEAAQSWGFSWHRNDGIEFLLVERGVIPSTVDEQELVLRTDDLVVTRPWQWHRVGNPHVPACRFHWLILDLGVVQPHQTWKWPSWLVLTPPDLHSLTAFLRHNEQPVWHVDRTIRRCFQEIATLVDTDENGSQASHLALRINEFLLLLLAMFRHQRIGLDASLASAERTVELFWKELGGVPEQLAREWSLPQMARVCGMGRTQFCELTRQITGLPPAHLLLQRRLEWAGELLRAQPERTVTEIALDCGFSTSQYFATRFRRHFGCTPRDFRQQGQV